MNSELEKLKTIVKFFDQYHNGILTRFELVNQLVNVPNSEDYLEEPISVPSRKSLKQEISELRIQVNNGETFVVGSNCPNIDIVSSFDQILMSNVFCLDVKALGGVDGAVQWIKLSYSTLENRKPILIAAVDRSGENLTPLVNLVDGIMERPDTNDIFKWEEAAKSLIKAIQDPEYTDLLLPEECHGGVSIEEFKETLAQTALSSKDHKKRD